MHLDVVTCGEINALVLMEIISITADEYQDLRNVNAGVETASM